MKTRPSAIRHALSGLTFLVGSFVVAATASACPFCTAQSQTITEEIKSADVALIVRLAADPKPAAPGSELDEELVRLPFDIVEVIKGKQHLTDTKSIKTLYFGQAGKGSIFIMFGFDPPKLGWSAPRQLSERAQAYVAELRKLPTLESDPVKLTDKPEDQKELQKHADRLIFFQGYLEDREELLAADAYDEFAKSPYKVVHALKPRLDHARLVGWIKDPDVSTLHRRLYLTLLSICGTAEDVPLIEKYLKSNDRTERRGLDALVNCYLVLRGPDGLALVEELFIKNAKSDFSDTYSAVTALRMQLEEIKTLPKDRVLASLRLMLDHPKAADLVMPDLARWEDWSAMDKLVDLFLKSTPENEFIRVPIVNYLRVCPKPEAKTHLETLKKLHPAAVQQAITFFPGLGPQPATPPDSSAEKKDDKKKEAKPGAASRENRKSDAPPASKPDGGSRKSA